MEQRAACKPLKITKINPAILLNHLNRDISLPRNGFQDI